VGGQCQTPATVPPQLRPVTHCTSGWVGLGASLDVHRKSRPH